MFSPLLSKEFQLSMISQSLPEILIKSSIGKRNAKSLPTARRRTMVVASSKPTSSAEFKLCSKNKKIRLVSTS